MVIDLDDETEHDLGEREERQERRGVAVEARFFGRFELRVNGVPMETWRGRRGLDVLIHVLASADVGQAVPRDVLIDTFWPDADPDRARNRLHVALSSVRRTVRRVADTDLIVCAERGYRLAPEVRLETDVTAFDRSLRAATTGTGRPDEIIDHLQTAVDLYAGDFLGDLPYEPWTHLPRESRRVSYLDALDRLVRLLGESGRLPECVAVAQRILSQDDCRQDVHRLLMRCHAALGRVRLLDRQYEMCREATRSSFGAEPDDATRRLHRRLRSSMPTSTDLDDAVLAGPI